VVAACRLVLAAIWLVAAYGKFDQPRAFLRSVLGFDLVPAPVVPWIAATLPGVECAIGFVLLVAGVAALAPGRVAPRFRPLLAVLALAAARIAAVLLAVFTAALVIDLLRGVKMDCGCFDVLGLYLGRLVPALRPHHADWGTVLRDIVMLVPALVLLRGREGRAR